MATTLQETVEKLGLENPKVYVGRERLYPVREGLTPSPRAIAAFEQALSSPESLKSSVKIMDGEQVVFKSAKGQVEVPLKVEAVPQPVSQVQTPVETVQAQPEPLSVQTAEIEGKTPQQTYLDLLKQSPEFEGVDVTYEDLQALSLEAMKPLDAIVIRSGEQNNLSRDEAESIIGAASPFIEKSVANIQTAAEELVTPKFVSATEQTQAENQAAKQTYLDLLKQHPDFPDKDITQEQLSEQSLVDGMLSDTYVVGMAYERGLSREELDRVIAQGSSYVRHQLGSGSLSNAQEYLTQISTGYHKKLQTQESTLETTQPTSVEPTTSEAVQTETAQQNVAQQVTYFDLLKEHPSFEALGITTYDELLEQPDSIQQLCDRKVSDMAIERGLLREKMDQVIGQASPYIRQKQAAGSFSTVQKYRNDLWFENQYRIDTQMSLPQRESYMDLSDAFYDNSPEIGDEYSELYVKAQENPAEARQNDTQVVLTAFKFKESPEYLEGALSESPYVQSQIKQGVPLAEMHEQYIAPIVAQYKEACHDKISDSSSEDNLRKAVEAVSQRQDQSISNAEVTSTPIATTPAPAKQFDYPKTAQTIDPAKDFRDTVQRGAATLQTHAVSAKENIELAQKNLATFAKTVKHRGFKAWAADQMPILKQKALDIAAEQGTKLKDWAKEQAPVMKEAAIHTAQFVAQQAFEKSSVAAVVAGQVGRVVADKAFEKGKGFGAVAWEKFEKATQLVDPDKLDPAIKDAIALFGKDGKVAGEEFNMQQSPDGKVSVHLKDGTPLYADGKVNLNVDSRLRFRLSQIPGNIEEIKSKIKQQLSVQQAPKKQVDSLEFSR